MKHKVTYAPLLSLSYYNCYKLLKEQSPRVLLALEFDAYVVIPFTDPTGYIRKWKGKSGCYLYE